MVDTREKTVRVISVDRRYIRQPYPAIAIWDDSKHCYLTGQHIDPQVPKTKNNLTVDEMTGKKMLSDEKLLRFPFIIDPEKNIPIIHMEKLNISVDEDGKPVNPNNMAKFVFIKYYCSFVAESKKSVRPDTDLFYIEDLEAEAEERVNAADLRYEAEKCIREKTSVRNWKDIALMLNYKIKNFSISIDTMSDTRIKDELLKACEKNFNEVIFCFKDDAKEELYIYKLVKHGILENKNGAYYDGNNIIGTSIDGVRMFMKSSKDDNQKYVTKWGKLLLEKEGKLSINPNPLTETYLSPKFETLDQEIAYINESSFDLLKKYAGTTKKYKGADWKDLDEEGLRKYLLNKIQS